MAKPVLLSGIQPSGILTIANYIGMLSKCIALQDKYESFFPLVDLHAITVKQNPNELRKRCYDFVTLYIASGLDSDNNAIFIQSHVPNHCELTWILNCYTYLGELNRMTQFKDKSKRYASNINAGLFSYPVLMAADILLYNTNVVPVGEDQKQHLELTRDIAIRFNNIYGDVFTIPEPYIPELGARIMSLQDPTKKMSKSDENANNYIALLDSPDIIMRKFKRAVTDSGKDIHYDNEKPGISNLLTLLSTITDRKISDLENEYKGIGYAKFKTDVAEAIIEFLKPIQKRQQELSKDLHYIDEILAMGAEKANVRAEKTLATVKQKIGLIKKHKL